jgi:hypothetical protein
VGGQRSAELIQPRDEIVECRQVLLVGWRQQAVAEPFGRVLEPSARLIAKSGSPVAGRFAKPGARALAEGCDRRGEPFGEVSRDLLVTAACLAGQALGEC